MPLTFDFSGGASVTFLSSSYDDALDAFVVRWSSLPEDFDSVVIEFDYAVSIDDNPVEGQTASVEFIEADLLF